MWDILSESSAASKALIGLFVVIVLAAVIVWVVRRFVGDSASGPGARGRQPRLAVVDAAPVGDGRRKLMIIRRDNVEHLLMIGGPTDVVVEQNIVRAAGPAREKVEPTLGRTLPASETLPRPVPLGEGSMFPLQPETNGRTPRTVPEESGQWTWPAPPEPQRPAPRAEPRLEKPDALGSLTDEFSARPVAPPRDFTRPVTPPVSRPVPAPPVAAAPVEKIEKIDKVEKASAPVPADTDQNLADMATRLESSLRRPAEPRMTPEIPMSMKTEPMTPAPTPRITPDQRITPPEPRVIPEQRIVQPEPRAAAPEPKPAPRPEAKPKAVFESLEEEMASLLGRPPGKT